MIGSTIDGKYLIQDLLGEGGMGAVYTAEHTGTGRRVAVKVINSGDFTKNKQVLSRFEREARAAGAIDTQYITQVLDAGVDRDSGLPFMAMEYMEGEDLMHLIKRVGPVAPELALRVAAQSCLGLQKAHAAKVVHRDIKPHNLFLAKRDAGEIVVKLLDFGIAKVKMDQAQSREGADLTKTGNLLGSPLYVSPEQARGKRQIDHRTDIYSLGAVLYQMLAGRTPFEHATALGELILMVCTEPPAPLQDFAPWVAPEVAEIVHKCLQKNPDERYQSAEELFEAVRGLLQGGWGIHEDMLVSLADSQRQEEAPRLPMSVPPPAFDSGRYDTLTASQADRTVSSDGSSTTGALTQTPNPASAPASSGSKVPMVLGIALVASLALGGAYVFTRGDDPQAAPATSNSAPPPPAPTPSVSAKQVASSAEPPKETKKRVKVVIRPEDAKVEVEGELTKLQNGLLELEGKPGQVFKVRAFKGVSETVADVVVTESGALPPIVEVEIGKQLVIKQGGKGPQPKSKEPSGPSGPAPPPPPGIDADMGEFGP